MLLYVGLKYKRKQRAWEDMENTAHNRVVSEATHLFHPHAHCPNQFYVSTEITRAGKCVPSEESLPNDNSLPWKGECYSLEASAHLQPPPHSQSQCDEFCMVDRIVYKQKELNASLDLLPTAWFWLLVSSCWLSLLPGHGDQTLYSITSTRRKSPPLSVLHHSPQNKSVCSYFIHNLIIEQVGVSGRGEYASQSLSRLKWWGYEHRCSKGLRDRTDFETKRGGHIKIY